MNAKSSLSQENSCHILTVRTEHSIKISCLWPLLEAFEHHEEKVYSVSVGNPTCTPENPAGTYGAMDCFQAWYYQLAFLESIFCPGGARPLQ